MKRPFRRLLLACALMCTAYSSAVADLLPVARNTFIVVDASTLFDGNEVNFGEQFNNSEPVGSTQAGGLLQANVFDADSMLAATAATEFQMLDDVQMEDGTLQVVFDTSAVSATEIFNDAVAIASARHNLSVSFDVEQAATYDWMLEIENDGQSGQVTEFLFTGPAGTILEFDSAMLGSGSGLLEAGNYGLAISFQANAGLSQPYATRAAAIDFELTVEQVVPEPQASVLLLLGLVLFRRRRVR